MKRFWILPAVAAVVGLAAGCGGGAKRYEVSGPVTFAGKPVPAGTVLFTPDPAQGNSGPQGRADIKDGQYNTADDGLGVVGGPMIVEVTGLTAEENGKVICRYKTTVELPKASSTQELAVPATAAVKEAPTGPPP